MPRCPLRTSQGADAVVHLASTDRDLAASRAYAGGRGSQTRPSGRSCMPSGSHSPRQFTRPQSCRGLRFEVVDTIDQDSSSVFSGRNENLGLRQPAPLLTSLYAN
jgi:hypothetical protein